VWRSLNSGYVFDLADFRPSLNSELFRRVVVYLLVGHNSRYANVQEHTQSKSRSTRDLLNNLRLNISRVTAKSDRTVKPILSVLFNLVHNISPAI